MGRIRLLSLVFSLLGLLLHAQGTFAQSPRDAGKNSPAKDDFSRGGRLRSRPPLPSSRKPEVFFCETPDTSCRTTQDTFPIDDLRDLFVFIVWPGVTGQHVQTVEFYLPEGSLYASRKTQFTVGGAASATMLVPAAQNEVSPLPPAPHLIPNANKIHDEGIPSLLMSSRGDSAVLSVLPVAGTFITQRNLTGIWRVRVLLDDRVMLQSEFTLNTRAVPVQPTPVKPIPVKAVPVKNEERDQQ